MKTKDRNLSNDVIEYAKKQYHCEPEYPWILNPDYAVLRHSENNKWFALFMTVTKDKLGMSGNDYVDILNIKVEPFFAEILIHQEGFLPPYHQKHGNWITVLLDGTVAIEEIQSLLEMSYNLTLPKNLITNPAYRNTKWIIPANPKYYDIEKAISESNDNTIIWKQSNRILVGDVVYIYVAAPISAIRYKCEAIEVDIPYNYSDENVSMRRVMKLKIIKTYESTAIKHSMLVQYGVRAVRGPRSMPSGLEKAIEVMSDEQ